jgi:hypothetical protein
VSDLNETIEAGYVTKRQKFMGYDSGDLFGGMIPGASASVRFKTANFEPDKQIHTPLHSLCIGLGKLSISLWCLQNDPIAFNAGAHPFETALAPSTDCRSPNL